MKKQIEVGQLLREKRLEFGWNVETVGTLYGNAVRGKPVTGGAIHTLEEGMIPASIKRRWVLAQLYGIAPALLGLDTMKGTINKIPYFPSRRTKLVDIQEYHASLLSYWKLGYTGTAETALKDLGQRIHALHDTVLYVNSTQKDQMKRLLCGYHMRRAEVARELSYTGSALEHLNKAVILARQEKYADLEATALYRRGEYFFDNWNFQLALKDLKTAQTLDRAPAPKYAIPPQVKGRILNARGLVESRIAMTNQDMKEALSWVDLSEQYVQPTVDDDVYALDLTRVRYLLNRAKTMVGSPVKELHMVDEAYDVNTEMIQQSDPEQKRFHAYHVLDSTIVQSIYYMDKSYFPIATTLAQDALSMMEEMNSTIHLPMTVRLYENLRATSYGKSTEVAELGLRLLFMQHPQMFN
jgi:tetratricopeptide (TPR) repeat protein